MEKNKSNSLDKQVLNLKNSRVSSNKGITLIALVVTIVVLLILAGVTINLVLADGGIFSKAEQAKEEQEKAEALDIMSLKILDATIEVYSKESRKANLQDLHEYLLEDTEIDTSSLRIEYEQTASNDELPIGNANNLYAKLIKYPYEFTIDSRLEIVAVEKVDTKADESIVIEVSQNVAADYTFSTITIKVTTSEEIESIKINGKNISEFEDYTENENNYEIKVRENNTYNVRVQDVNGKYNSKKIQVTEIADDLEIGTKEDLIKFRNKVNSGATFEGKTVKLTRDIELNERKYTVAEDGTIIFNEDAENWIPIGDGATNAAYVFKGKFEGNNKKITGIYINTNTDYQGLFGKIENSEIKNLRIQGKVGTNEKSDIGLLAGYSSGETIDNIIVLHGSTVIGKSNIGGLIGRSVSGQISNVTNFSNINASDKYIGGICGNSTSNFIRCGNKGNISGINSVGGILGIGFGPGVGGNNQSQNIMECYNEANLEASAGIVGGIVAEGNNASVMYCYNKGSIKGNGGSYLDSASSNAGGITGILGFIKYCYNRGDVYGKLYQVGGISGNTYNGGNNRVQYCYNTGTITGGGRVGSIIGQANGTTFSSCWWTSSLGGNGNGGSYTDSDKVDESTLKGYATKLGEYFTDDTNIINDGFPILKWQSDQTTTSTM